MPLIYSREVYQDINKDDGYFPQLVYATIATSSISIIATSLIIISYIHVRLNSPIKADRISLRCVFMSSVMNLINSIFDICTILRDGDTIFCKSTSIISMFTGIMGVNFLTIVGINLILVFVFKVKKTTRKLEWIYYTWGLIYGFVTISVPISEQTRNQKTSEIVKNYRCFYYIYYYQFFDNSSLLWMWFYSFLFFSIFVAALCSAIATIKIIIQKRSITREESPTLENASNDDHRSKSKIFKSVIIRCVMYPLVPLVSNIWGLIFQLLINGKKITYGNNLAFSMLYTVFGSLEGAFVSIIFFSDPTMIDYIKNKFNSVSLTRKQSQTSRLITPSSSSFKQPYIITSPTPVLTRSNENFFSDNSNQKAYIELSDTCILQSMSTEPRVSFQTENIDTPPIKDLKRL